MDAPTICDVASNIARTADELHRQEMTLARMTQGSPEHDAQAKLVAEYRDDLGKLMDRLASLRNTNARKGPPS